MATNRNQAAAMLANLRGLGLTDTEILEYILNDYLSGAQAVEALSEFMNEFGLDETED